MHRSIPRLVAAGLASTCVLTVPLVGAAAGAQPAPPSAPCGSLGPPLCAAIDQFEAAVAPLQPIFALGAPFMEALGGGLHDLQTTLEQVSAGPVDALDAQGLAERIGGLLGVASSVDQPLATLLGVSPLGPLVDALEQLQAALVGGPAASSVTAAGAAPSASSPVVLPKVGFGGTPSSAAGAGGTVPSVPEGLALELPDLPLPDFGARAGKESMDRSSGVARAADLDLPELPVVEGFPVTDETSDAAALAAVMAASGVLLTTGLLAGRVRTGRRPG